MTHTFNPDLEAGGHTFNLGHTFYWKCLTVHGADFEVFFSSFTGCDSHILLPESCRTLNYFSSTMPP